MNNTTEIMQGELFQRQGNQYLRHQSAKEVGQQDNTVVIWVFCEFIGLYLKVTGRNAGLITDGEYLSNYNYMWYINETKEINLNSLI